MIPIFISVSRTTVICSPTTKDVIAFDYSPKSGFPAKENGDQSTSTSYKLLNELLDVKLDEEKQVDIEAKGLILSGGVSPNNHHLVLTNDYKQVFLLDVSSSNLNDWMLKACYDAPKKAVSIVFLRDSQAFLLADKFGDVSRFNVNHMDVEPDIVLGHLSMLLDIKLMRDDSRVVTCDRDEKIRVSRYPNTYNIQSYCLSHSKSILALQVMNDLLLSSSVDLTLKLWNPESGQLLQTINITDIIPNCKAVFILHYMNTAQLMVCIPVNSKHIFSLAFDEGSHTLRQGQTIELDVPVLSCLKQDDDTLTLLVESPEIFRKLDISKTMTLCAENPSVDASCLKDIEGKLSGTSESQEKFIAGLEKMSSENVLEFFEKKSRRDDKQNIVEPPNKIQKVAS